MKEALKLALDALTYIHAETSVDEDELIDKAITAIKAALVQEQEPVDFTSLLREAKEIVQSKPTWKRFIDGTPLSDDIAVWMAVFAQDVARRIASQPAQQEPVAWMRPSKDGYDSAFRDHSTVVRCTGNPWAGWVPLYTAPQASVNEAPQENT